MSIVSKALVEKRQPHDVIIASHVDRRASVGSTREVIPGTGISVARTDNPELSAWLAFAINQTLDHQEIEVFRPVGRLVRYGRFEASGPAVFARGIGGRVVEVVRCYDHEEAGSVAAWLQALLEDRAIVG